MVSGEIVTIKPRRQWRYAGHPYRSGEFESTRLDVPALGLVPLRLEEIGMWDPKEHYWGEEDEPMDKWAKGSLKNNFTFYTPMHLLRLRCESSEYPDIPAFSRLAGRAPQHLKL